MSNAVQIADAAETQEAVEPDTLFGVCQAVGEDLGFNPFLLRVAFIGILFFNPAVMAGAYVALGVIVFASRLIFPKTGSDVAEQAVQSTEPELLAA